MRIPALVSVVLLAACGPQKLAGDLSRDGTLHEGPDLTDDTGHAPTESETDTTETDTSETTDPGTMNPGTTTTEPGTTTTDPGTTTTDPGTTGGCPPGVTCIDTFPTTVSGTTTSGTSDLDGYSCAPGIDESGPENVYQVTLDEPGFLGLEIWGEPSGVDVDVHLLESLDAGDCIDRGHYRAGSLMPPGTYYVVVDSWVDSAGVSQDGSYSLDLNLTTPETFVGWGLEADVLERALYAFDEAWFEGETDSLVYGIIDFTVPSTDPRFFIFDLANGDMLFDVHTSHGIGSQDASDLTMANDFSNISGSEMSSLGMVQAAETYYGSHGYSLRLDGLDSTYNDNVRSRAIVIHSADYATQDFVDTYGYLGRSQGCPAVDPDISDALIDTLTIEGALVLKYSDTNNFLSAGRFMPGF